MTPEPSPQELQALQAALGSLDGGLHLAASPYESVWRLAGLLENVDSAPASALRCGRRLRAAATAPTARSRGPTTRSARVRRGVLTTQRGLVDRAGRREPAEQEPREPCAQVLSPEVARPQHLPRSRAASLSPETSRAPATIAATIQPRRCPGRRGRSGRRGRAACPPWDRAASPGRTGARSVARAARRTSRWPWPRQTGPSPSSQGGVPPKRRTTKGAARARATEPVGNGQAWREYAGHGAVLEGSRRKPGRDRNPDCTLRELEIEPVAVYSEPDHIALHVQVAPEAYLLGPGVPTESYLNQSRILEAAQRAGAQAVHPGYGFLAENAGFARACAEAGLTWIGLCPRRSRRWPEGSRPRDHARRGSPDRPGDHRSPSAPAADVVKLGDVPRGRSRSRLGRRWRKGPQGRS